MADGFLSRWSRRKLDAKEGRAPGPAFPEAGPPFDATPEADPAGRAPLAQPAAATADAGTGDAGLQPPATARVIEGATGEMQLPQPADRATPGREAPPPPPSLDDVARLDSGSDFSRFVARDVSPDVKNAALKKLFADPRFNVMDGMDVYIDDYSQPDPLPDSMLRKLAAAQFLKLFDEAPKEDGTQSPVPAVANDCPAGAGAQSVAQSAPSREENPAPSPEISRAPESHADPDLRLQQDDAPPGEDPGPGDR